MKKNIVVFGGGSGLSTLLRGLKLFPVNITAVVSLADSGGSTGKLRKEFNMPAVGDVRKVIGALSETEPLIESLLEYRFKSNTELEDHTTGNILLTSLVDLTGSVSEAVKALGKVLNIKGKILPLSEDSATLVAKTKDNEIIEGEGKIEEAHKIINEVYYKEKITPAEEVIKAMQEADLILFSMGTLYGSILPNLILPEIIKTLKEVSAPKVIVANLMTEYGEEENFKVSDFLKVINKHTKEKVIDVVIANNGEIDPEINKRYKDMDNSNPLILDEEEIEKMGIKLIQGDFVEILEEKDLKNIKRIDKMVRHNTLKLALTIYTYLMEVGD